MGRGIALRLARDGAVVAVHYGSNRRAAEEAVHEIERSGGSAFAIGADLSVTDNIQQLYAALDEELQARIGDNRFDIPVNNAGNGLYATIEETTEQSFDDLMNLLAKAPFFLIQQALPRMKDEGRIINISSSATRIAFPNLIGYSISKGAVDTLTYVLAQHLESHLKITDWCSFGVIMIYWC
ncbi:SDR family NAD(P)-dependent oxidoreductase [Cohnella sp. CBP 2801]|uniref:SDR family NAD(P)-dependent oxidoreductase n=1 Tax=Cohnella zeiphila TaxID=2761120 RepID=A0A7X0VUZ4_9BACL|nr:SDR family NAD(P)-dependent oxidoreductase [Cohnella zeiphila]